MNSVNGISAQALTITKRLFIGLMTTIVTRRGIIRRTFAKVACPNAVIHIRSFTQTVRNRSQTSTNTASLAVSHTCALLMTRSGCKLRAASCCPLLAIVTQNRCNPISQTGKRGPARLGNPMQVLPQAPRPRSSLTSVVLTSTCLILHACFQHPAETGDESRSL